MSALGDIAAALGPAAQGIGQGLSTGRQLQLDEAARQAQLGMQQQGIDLQAQRQAELARQFQSTLGVQHETMRRSRLTEIDAILNDPTVTMQMATSDSGRKRLAALVAERNSLDPQNPMDATAYQHDPKRAGLVMLKELESELQYNNIPRLIQHGIDPKQVFQYYQKLHAAVNDPNVSDTRVHEILMEHAPAAKSAYHTVRNEAGGEIPFGAGFDPLTRGPIGVGSLASQPMTPTTAAAPAAPVLFGPGFPGSNVPTPSLQSGANLAPMLKQILGAIPQQPEMGDPVVNPVDPQAIGILRTAMKQGISPPPQVQDPVAAALQAGLVKSQAPEAMQRFAGFDPLAQANQIASVSGGSPLTALPFVAKQQELLGAQAGAQNALDLRPLQLIKAGLEARKDQAGIISSLAEAGYKMSQPALDAAKNLIEAQKAGFTNHLELAKFHQTQAEFSNKLDQQWFDNATKADRLVQAQRQMEIQGAARQARLVIKEFADAAPREVDGSQSNFSGGAGWGIAKAGVNYGKTATVFGGRVYYNVPEVKSAVEHLKNLIQQPGAIVANTPEEALALHGDLAKPPQNVSDTLRNNFLASIGQIKRGLASGGFTDPSNPSGPRIPFVDAVNRAMQRSPAYAILAMRMWKASHPKQPLPSGIDLAPLTGQLAMPDAAEGPQPAATSTAPPPLVKPPAPTQSVSPLGGALDYITKAMGNATGPGRTLGGLGAGGF